MECLSDLNNFIDINISDPQNSNYQPAYDIYMDNTTKIDTLLQKLHLIRTREYLYDLKSDLNTVLDHLEIIIKASEKYIKTKESSIITEVHKNIQQIMDIFADNIYQYKKISDTMTGSPYTLRVFVGQHMDQCELLPLGLPDTDKSFVDILQLGKIRITQPQSSWLPIFEKAYTLVTLEIEKINTHLRRLDFFDAYNDILSQGIIFWDFEQKINSEHTIVFQKQLLARTISYMSLTIDALQEIKKCAYKNLEELKQGRDRTMLVFHTEQILNEVSRIASYSNFDGMYLLTGRYTPDSQTGHLNLYIDTDITQTISVYIPDLTPEALIIPNNLHYSWENPTAQILATPESTKDLITKTDNSIRSINKP